MPKFVLTEQEVRRKFGIPEGVELVIESTTPTLDSILAQVPVQAEPAQDTDSGQAWESVRTFNDHFYEINMVITGTNRTLTNDEIMEASGCLGYALREVIRGDALSQPNAVVNQFGYLHVEYSYDSTKTQSDDPDFQEAFDLAESYVQYGTPVRTTNRSGPNTKGTRLCNGIGTCYVQFYVR